MRNTGEKGFEFDGRDRILSMEAADLRQSVTDSIRYWEPRRLIYNAVLAAIVLTYYWLRLPLSKQVLSIDLELWLFALAVLANVAYCAAYIADVFAQASGFRETWRNYRWVLFTIGLAFAGVLTRFWSIGLFGPASP